MIYFVLEFLMIDAFFFFLNDIVIQIFSTKTELLRNSRYFWSELPFYNNQFYHVLFYEQVTFIYISTDQGIFCFTSISDVVCYTAIFSVVTQRT